MRAHSTYRASRRNEAKVQASYIGARISTFWALLPFRELKMKHSKSKINVGDNFIPMKKAYVEIVAKLYEAYPRALHNETIYPEASNRAAEMAVHRARMALKPLKWDIVKLPGGWTLKIPEEMRT